MSEKFTKNALKRYQNGEKNLSKGKHMKAEADFEKALEFFLKANEIQRAEACSLKLVECYIIEKRYYDAAKAVSRAAELILRQKERKAQKIYKSAINHYQSAIDFYEKVGAELELLEIHSLIILCYIVQGKFEEGIALLKKKIAKSTLPQIKNSRIIQFTSLAINTILKKDKASLEEIEYQLTKVKLDPGLMTLFKTVQELIKQYVDTIITITPDRKDIRAGDDFQVKIEVKNPPELEIEASDLIFDRIFDLVEEKSMMPDRRIILFRLRPRIPGSLKIGPISLFCKTGGFEFPLKIQKILEILPGLPDLVIESETPTISTSKGIPVTITLNVKNIGKGECMNLSIQIILAENLRLLEGTLEKKLHALGPHEEFSFTFRMIANDKVDAQLLGTMKYDDLEGHPHEMAIKPIPFTAS